MQESLTTILTEQRGQEKQVKLKVTRTSIQSVPSLNKLMSFQKEQQQKNEFTLN